MPDKIETPRDILESLLKEHCPDAIKRAVTLEQYDRGIKITLHGEWPVDGVMYNKVIFKKGMKPFLRADNDAWWMPEFYTPQGQPVQ